MPDEAIDVLLVEDSVDDSTFITNALEEANLGVRLRVARDGVRALASIFGDENSTEGPPAFIPKLIILDLKLPKIDGIEVLRRLKSNPHTRAIPVVVLSSSHERRDLVACYDLGVNSYFVKPMDFDEFSEMVKMIAHYWLKFNHTLK